MENTLAKKEALEVKSEYRSLLKQLETDRDEGVNQVVFTIDTDKFSKEITQYFYEYHFHQTVIQLRDRLNLGVKVSYFPFENPNNVTVMFDGTISYLP